MTEEQKWDKKLNIRTAGRVDTHADAYHHPYEPTPYPVLQRLAESGYLYQESVLVDYGCGKGRVGFFFSHVVGCRTIGLEYDEEIFCQAMENRRRFRREERVSIRCMRAEAFEVHEADCFYFFNPFSVEILKSVMGRMTESYYHMPRRMRLFFYYPNDAYLTYLMTMRILTYVDEIDCRDFFGGKDERERILIFEIA